MFQKTIVVLAVIGYAYNTNILALPTQQNDSSLEQRIKNAQFQVLANVTRAKLAEYHLNPKIYPATMLLRDYVKNIKIYHDNSTNDSTQKERKLEKEFFLPKFLQTMARTNNAQLNYSSLVVYDKNKTSEEFLQDVRTHYNSHTKALAVFDKEKISEQVIDWIISSSDMRSTAQSSALLASLLPEVSNRSVLEANLLTFKGCWDTPKTSVDSAKLMDFSTTGVAGPPSRVILTIKMMTGQAPLGYYSNPKLNYHAARFPLKNAEFSLTFVLPDQKKELSIFSQFDASNYDEIFEHVSKHKANIDYAIPYMNMPTIKVNENGVSVLANKPICDWSSISNQTDENSLADGIDYKPFHLTSPFGAFLYHEKTKTVLASVYVHDLFASGFIQGSRHGTAFNYG